MIRLLFAACFVSLSIGSAVPAALPRTPIANHSVEELLTEDQLTEYGLLKQSLAEAPSDDARASMLKERTLTVETYRLIVKLEMEHADLQAALEQRKLAADTARRSWIQAHARNTVSEQMPEMQRFAREQAALSAALVGESIAAARLESLRANNAPAESIAKAQQELDAARAAKDEAHRKDESVRKDREKEMLRRSDEARVAAFKRSLESKGAEPNQSIAEVLPVVGDVAGLFDSPNRAANKQLVRDWLEKKRESQKR
jgi:hypothetical protein